MNGFSAADMSTAAANGFSDGLAAQSAESQEAVATAHWKDGRIVHVLDCSAMPDGTHRLYAAPVAAAPAVDVATLRALADRWANDRSYTGSPVDDIRALIEQPTVSTPASSADSAVLTNPYTGQPRDYRDVESDPAGTLIVEPGKPLEAASTPAAPGIDLHAPCTEAVYALARKLLWIAYVWNDHNFDHPYQIARKLAQGFGIESFDQANAWLTAQAKLIDASPKSGGVDNVTRSAFQRWAVSQNLSVQRSEFHLGMAGDYVDRDTSHAWEAWQAAMQATSAEVGA